MFYSTSKSVNDALTNAYKIAFNDKAEDVAMFLRGIFPQAFNKYKSLPWLVTADYLDIKSPEGFLPPGRVKVIK